MYRTFDEEIFLAPESIISGVLATAAYAEDPELPDIEPFPQSWDAVAARPEADADDSDADTDTDEPTFVGATVDPIDTWSRHARAASGFGG